MSKIFLIFCIVVRMLMKSFNNNFLSISRAAKIKNDLHQHENIVNVAEIVDLVFCAVFKHFVQLIMLSHFKKFLGAMYDYAYNITHHHKIDGKFNWFLSSIILIQLEIVIYAIHAFKGYRSKKATNMDDWMHRYQYVGHI